MTSLARRLIDALESMTGHAHPGGHETATFRDCMHASCVAVVRALDALPAPTYEPLVADDGTPWFCLPSGAPTRLSRPGTVPIYRRVDPLDAAPDPAAPVRAKLNGRYLWLTSGAELVATDQPLTTYVAVYVLPPLPAGSSTSLTASAASETIPPAFIRATTTNGDPLSKNARTGEVSTSNEGGPDWYELWLRVENGWLGE